MRRRGRSNLLRRLEDLEGRVTNRSCLVQWAKVISGEDPGEPGTIPLEVWDAIAD
jgi:hypothetical protein